MQVLYEKLSAHLDEALEWATVHKDPIRRYGLGASLVIFAGGLYLAIAGNPELVSNLWYAPLVALIVISAPLGTLLNAAELWALSRIAGGPMTWRTSLDLTIYTSAANMLPLPGGAITKLAGFKAHGVGYGAGTAMILLSFLIWGGLAFLYASVSLAMLGRPDISGIFLLAGIALLASSAVGFRRFGHWGMVAIVAATRLANFVIEAVRYWLALTAMGITVTLLQCSVFVVVAFIGAAVVVVPSGLGVSEAAGALVATVVGISAASGFISTAIQRVARLIGLAVLALVFMVMKRGDEQSLEFTPDRADNPEAR